MLSNGAPSKLGWTPVIGGALLSSTGPLLGWMRSACKRADGLHQAGFYALWIPIDLLCSTYANGLLPRKIRAA